MPTSLENMFGASKLGIEKLHATCPLYGARTHNNLCESVSSACAVLVPSFQVYDGLRSSGKGKSEPATSERKLVQTLTGPSTGYETKLGPCTF